MPASRAANFAVPIAREVRGYVGRTGTALLNDLALFEPQHMFSHNSLGPRRRNFTRLHLDLDLVVPVVIDKGDEVVG